MKIFLAATSALAALALALTSTAQETDDDGFTVLYGGDEPDLSQLDTEGNWQVQEDGSLHLEPREGEKGWTRYGSYLWLKDSDYADFTFEFEYLLGKGGNSGFYFRTGDRVDPTKSGFEVQLLDCPGKADDEMGHHDHGGVIRTAGTTSNAGNPTGEWDHISVTLQDNQLTVVLNGVTVQDINLDEARSQDKELHAEGGIAIQDHGLPFSVRNLRIKRL